jgi:hypothetical protein
MRVVRHQEMIRKIIVLVIGITLAIYGIAAGSDKTVQIEVRVISDSVNVTAGDVSPDRTHYLKCTYYTEVALMLADKPIVIRIVHPSRYVPELWTETGVAITVAVPKAMYDDIRLGQSGTPLKAEEISIIERKIGPYNASEAARARETLLSYFKYLRSGQYEQAVTLFEPWEEGVGIQHSSWHCLSTFSPWEERTSKPKVLEHSCGRVTCSLRSEVLDDHEVAEGQYMFRVQFFNDDGTEFVLGRCCDAPECPEVPIAGPPPGRRGWPHYVHNLNGRYVVRTPPIFEP